MKVLPSSHPDQPPIVDKPINKTTECKDASNEGESSAKGLIKNLITGQINLAQKIYDSIMKTLHDLNVFKKIENVFDFLAKNPIIALPICAFMMLVGIPLFVLIVFAFVSSSVTFMGFVILEGTIIASGVIVLGGILLVVLGTLMMIAIIVSIICFGFQKANIIKT